MKSVRILGKGKVTIEDVPDPTPDDQSVILKVKASALCGSEMHEVRGDTPSQSPGRYNTGHEVVGEIIHAPANSPYPVGTRVGARVVQGCGDVKNCRYCRAGDETGCRNLRIDALNGHSELFKIGLRGMHPLPDGVADVPGAILTGDGLGVPVRCAKRLGDTSGKTVVILGQGPVGLGCTLVQAWGKAEVMATDISTYRLNLATSLGAKQTVNVAQENLTDRVMAWTDGMGADVVILAVANEAVLSSAFDVVRRHGMVFQVAELGKASFVFNAAFIRREATMTGSWYYSSNDWPNMLALHEDGLPYDKLVTHTFGIDQAQEAFDTFINGESGKVVLTY